MTAAARRLDLPLGEWVSGFGDGGTTLTQQIRICDDNSIEPIVSTTISLAGFQQKEPKTEARHL